MADVYEKDLAQKSSLTISDFIRVVGSDNVSYKQPFTSLGEGFLPFINGYANVDANTFTTTGIFYLKSGLSNMPAAYLYLQVYRAHNNTTSDILQRAFSYAGDVWSRRSRDGGTTWTDWVKQPTRAEVDGAIRAKGSLAVNTDLDTITTPSTYQLAGAYTNMPDGSSSMWGQLVVIKSSGGYTTQIFYQVPSGRVFIRNLDNQTWTSWVKQPERSEVDALNNRLEWKVVPSSIDSLTALQSYIDSLYTDAGSASGTFSGYIPSNAATAAGLSGSHYFQTFSNSANYRIIVVYSINGDRLRMCGKNNGTWATAWKYISLA